MTDDDRLRNFLRTTLPPAAAQEPSRDLWPLVVDRFEARVAWSWLDIGLAAIVAILLMMFPKCFLLLAYHL